MINLSLPFFSLIFSVSLRNGPIPFADELLRSMGCGKKGEETPRTAIRKKKSNGEVSSVLAQSTRYF